ncbi:hypothetical protein EDD18DRAFT_1103542 [Armillaria luteobubalina]|uniref:Uncharacterized protein n=1 Tax=Armillaria luteobubalina TaxID=153913 RepID=A0AA39QA76_9AGAR|nr:hypothetical protein EDD18DRAFT_1103542 [Armillaria luteobubalina]
MFSHSNAILSEVLPQTYIHNRRCNFKSMSKQMLSKVFRHRLSSAVFDWRRSPKISTTGEVAAMEYVRVVIGHFTPRTPAWSSTPQARSAVGSDFILMERINSVLLEKHWFSSLMKALARDTRNAILLNLALPTTFFTPRPELHSRPIYMAKKVNKEDVAEKYRIGPVIDKQYRLNELMEGDRGPWPDMVSFIQATCRSALRRAGSRASSAASSSPSPSSLMGRSMPSGLPCCSSHYINDASHHSGSIGRALLLFPTFRAQGYPHLTYTKESLSLYPRQYSLWLRQSPLEIGLLLGLGLGGTSG